MMRTKRFPRTAQASCHAATYRGVRNVWEYATPKIIIFKPSILHITDHRLEVLWVLSIEVNSIAEPFTTP